MSTDKYMLGIDTSNYKTSLAIICGDKIICDNRRLLTVKNGERGLRQSEALFQHVNNLPEMFTELRKEFEKRCGEGSKISAVAYSSRPRPIDGSYMPCFLAGKSQAISIAAMLSIPALEFSHQEGHIEAIRRFAGGNTWGEGEDLLNENRTPVDEIGERFTACHFSGGTCEVLNVTTKKGGYEIDIIGGTKDISFGQVLDRTGVALGMAFPCGEKLDEIALTADNPTEILTPVSVKGGEINLSGFESQIQRALKRIKKTGSDADMCGEITQEINPYNQTCENISAAGLIREIFEKISDSIYKMLVQTTSKANTSVVLMSGGVSSSRFIRNRIIEINNKSKKNKQKIDDINLVFDEHNLSSDNAVGIALLGSRCLWD